MNTISPVFKPLVLTSSILLALTQTHVVVATPPDYAYFDSDQGHLVLPEIDAGVLGSYALRLLVSSFDPISFELDQDSLTFVTTRDKPDAVYDVATGQLHIPAVLVGSQWYSGELQQMSDTADYHFRLSQMTHTQVPATSVDTRIVDTGQTLCYDNHIPVACPEMDENFFGQDAQYVGTAANYTINGDGTVTDHATGLMWVQSTDTNGDGDINVSDKFSISDAKAYVAQLNQQQYAGYNDWRLPSIKEQYSLIDFRGTDPSGDDTERLIPFIDTEVFAFAYGDTDANERTIDAQYASSTYYVSTASGEKLLFGVNFADGRIKGYGLQIMGRDKTFYIQPVRGNVYGENQFVDNEDATITDTTSGLMWTQNDSGIGMNWQQAFAWVAQKNAEDYLGYNDWRLPNIKELQFIVDYSRSPDTSNSAAIDPVFNATLIQNEAGQADYAYYWSSTTHASANGMGVNGAYVAFGRALGYMNGNWRDVHGAGSQRSDPKTGDAADYPTGHGPQGDAIRIDNYVRLVRSGVSDSIHIGGDVPEINVESTSTAQTPPQEAITACASLNMNDGCRMQTPQGHTMIGFCRTVGGGTMACVPENAPLN